MTTRRIMDIVVVPHGFGLTEMIVGAVEAGARGGAAAAWTRTLVCHVINRVEFIHVINREEFIHVINRVGG